MAKKRTVTGTWADLRLAPTTLVRLCVVGKAVVVGTDKYGRKIWRVERDAISVPYGGTRKP